MILQGQIEATEIRISVNCRDIDTFLIEGRTECKVGEYACRYQQSQKTWAKFQQINALEDIAKYQNKKIDDGTRGKWCVQKNFGINLKVTFNCEVTYDRIQNLYRIDSVVTSQRKDEVEAVYKSGCGS